MRFVITVEDVILFGLLAVSVVLMIVGVALNLIRKIGERAINKVKERRDNELVE